MGLCYPVTEPSTPQFPSEGLVALRLAGIVRRRQRVEGEVYARGTAHLSYPISFARQGHISFSVHDRLSSGHSNSRTLSAAFIIDGIGSFGKRSVYYKSLSKPSSTQPTTCIRKFAAIACCRLCRFRTTLTRLRLRSPAVAPGTPRFGRCVRWSHPPSRHRGHVATNRRQDPAVMRLTLCRTS